MRVGEMRQSPETSNWLWLLQTGDSEINQSAHVHKACMRPATKKHGRGLLQKGTAGDQKPVLCDF